METYFYILIVATGMLTTITDIREKKIKNSHLRIITGFALALYCIAFFSGVLKPSLPIILNPLVALIIGFSLYLSGLWKAGDAKLFITYSLLLPINRYVIIAPLSCLILGINTFLLCFLLILPFSLITIINSRAYIIKAVISRGTLVYLAQILLVTSALSWVINPLINRLPFKNNVFTNFTILFCGYSFMFRFIGKIKQKIILIFIFLTGLVAHYVLEPHFFLLSNILAYAKSILIYSGAIYLLTIVIKFDEQKWKRIPLSPFLFLGATLSSSAFLWWIIKFLQRMR